MQVFDVPMGEIGLAKGDTYSIKRDKTVTFYRGQTEIEKWTLDREFQSCGYDPDFDRYLIMEMDGEITEYSVDKKRIELDEEDMRDDFSPSGDFEENHGYSVYFNCEPIYTTKNHLSHVVYMPFDMIVVAYEELRVVDIINQNGVLLGKCPIRELCECFILDDRKTLCCHYQKNRDVLHIELIPITFE